jgi:hypothetical protein
MKNIILLDFDNTIISNNKTKNYLNNKINYILNNKYNINDKNIHYFSKFLKNSYNILEKLKKYIPNNILIEINILFNKIFPETLIIKEDFIDGSLEFIEKFKKYYDIEIVSNRININEYINLHYKNVFNDIKISVATPLKPDPKFLQRYLIEYDKIFYIGDQKIDKEFVINANKHFKTNKFYYYLINDQYSDENQIHNYANLDIIFYNLSNNNL